MKRYEDRTHKIVLSKELVEAYCDMCGLNGDNLFNDSLPFRYCNVGSCGGKVEYARAIDGDYDSEELDLCEECAEWLLEGIRKGKIRRGGG